MLVQRVAVRQLERPIFGVMIRAEDGEYEVIHVGRLSAAGELQDTNVPVGTYWALIDFKLNGKHYIWNTRVDVRPGANTITLDEKNPFVVY